MPLLSRCNEMDKQNTLDKKDIAKKVWLKLFHPLPDGSLVRIKNKAFTTDNYTGEILYTRKNISLSRRGTWHYVIRVRGSPLNGIMWVKADKVMKVLRYGKEKKV